MDIKSVFDAEPISSWHLLCQTGEGFYVPAYQRDYSWDKENIARLFEDVTHGIGMLVESDDAITFLGTIIVIHDTKYETVAPHVQGQLPGKVKVVIDGQQRLCTLLLIATRMLNMVSTLSYSLRKSDGVAYIWILRKSVEIMSQLRKTFEQDMDYGEDEFQWYPRIIRAYEDSWSRDRQNAKYESPIAAYLHGFSTHARKESHKKFIYSAQADSPKHRRMADNCKYIDRELKEMIETSDSDYEFPELSEIASKKSFQMSLLNAPLPSEVQDILTVEKAEGDALTFQFLFRLIVVSRYLMERVSVTLVTAKNELYAFDMFEALNTTGEPLTAFETFRPLVINAEGLSNYETSVSRKSMQVVEKYLDSEQFRTAQQKQRATTRLLLPFALAETGRKLSKKLSDQRVYLRDEYDVKCARAGDDKEEQRRCFVRHLAHAAAFVDDVWPDRHDQDPDLVGAAFSPSELNLCKMLLAVLREQKHEIAMAPLIRFFSQLRLASASEVKHASREFLDAVKAAVAFFSLWRSSRASTEGIDSLYRTLMRDGTPTCPAVARRPLDASVDKFTAEAFRISLRKFLEDKGLVSSEAEYVKRARSQPIYHTGGVARFLLFVSTHDTVVDASAPGLVRSGRRGTLNMLTVEQWMRGGLTIEHIAPQSRNDEGWAAGFYEDVNTVHHIGNLCLVPQRENASLGKRSWALKRLIYSVLSADNLDDVERLLGDAKLKGLELAGGTTEILQQSAFLPQLRSIASVSGDWKIDLVNQRSDRLLQLVWNRLSPWLGFES